jgi:hypothetical protein
MATLYVTQDGMGGEDGSTPEDSLPLSDVGGAWNWGANEYFLLDTLTSAIVLSNINGPTLRGDYAGRPGRITGVTGIGIQFSAGTRNVTLRGLEIDECTSRGLYHTTPGNLSTLNLYRDLYIHDCGGNGIRLGSTTTNTLSNVRMYNVQVDRCLATAILLLACPGARLLQLLLQDNGRSAGDENDDGLAIDDGSHGTIAKRVRVYRQLSAQGSGIDSQASLVGDTDPIRLIACLVVGSQHSDYSNTGVPDTYFDGCVSDRSQGYAFYTKGTATGVLNNCTSILPGANHIKSGDTEGDDHTMTVKNHLMVGKAGSVDVYHNDVGTLDMDYCLVPTTATYTDADAGTNAVEADAEINDDYSLPTDSPARGAGTWIAGARAFDDLPLGVHPDIGAVQDRDDPDRIDGALGQI